MVSLAEYVENMKEDQRYIFYLPAGNRAQAESSPYLETIKSKGFEVLFMYDPYDEVVLSRMERFKEKTLFSIENDIIDDKHQEHGRAAEGIFFSLGYSIVV